LVLRGNDLADPFAEEGLTRRCRAGISFAKRSFGTRRKLTSFPIENRQLFRMQTE
jgi:hypothetical protein